MQNFLVFLDRMPIITLETATLINISIQQNPQKSLPPVADKRLINDHSSQTRTLQKIFRLWKQQRVSARINKNYCQIFIFSRNTLNWQNTIGCENNKEF